MGKRARQRRRDEIAALLMNRLLQRIPMGSENAKLLQSEREAWHEALELAARDAVIAADLLISELDASENLMREDAPQT